MNLRASLLLLLAAHAGYAQVPGSPVRAVTDPGVITTRQQLTPAGVSSVFAGKVYAVAFDGKDNLAVATSSHVYRLDWRENKVIEESALQGTAGVRGLQVDGSRLLVPVTRRVAGKSRAVVQVSALENGSLKTIVEDAGEMIGGGLQIAGRRALLPLTFNNQLAIIDLDSASPPRKVATGIAPFAVAVNRAGTIAYVANWGGLIPQSGDLTAPTGPAPTADRVLIDKRGVASSGTLTRIDLATGSATHQIAVGLHPTALAWDEGKSLLYVANTNSDSITIVDTNKQSAAGNIRVQPFARSTAPGIAPTSLVLSPDGARLYVACGGINAVAVIATGRNALLGLIPTAWYPSSLALSADGKRLAIGSLLGAGSGSRDDRSKRFVHANRGAVQVVELSGESQLAAWSAAVAENNRLVLAGDALAAAKPKASSPPSALPVPMNAGDPSSIEHVVYIIKENRTYDQLFGDLQKGNGDPSMVLFGRDVTPNQHRLAEQFVLLDNFYATGGNSANGHQWATQANETSYTMYPAYEGRSYPYDGSDPLAYSQGGFLWDAAAARGKTARVYGEFVPAYAKTPRSQRMPLFDRWKKGDDFTKEFNVTSPIPGLDKILARNFPSYTHAIPDVVRAQIFLSDLKQWNTQGGMPNLMILLLPNDHTSGTSPGFSTPKAMVADNDLAVGLIVEGLTQSKFWPKMAIFVVEDDAQGGVDHVDGHRTVALAISPYVRRGAVDSTFYSQQSMVKTIELMLGLPHLSIFDLIANDMRASFDTKPDLTPYRAEQPKQSLWELNPPLQSLQGPARQGARASARMNWREPDDVPSERLNRILWHSVRGWQTPYPAARTAVFAPWDGERK